MAQVSKFKIYSIGVVAANKEIGEDNCEITAIELNPMLNGELTDQVDDYTAKGVDVHGSTYEIGTKVGVTVTAKWLPVGQGNRMTPPDVRRGEEVIIYNFGDDTNTFWWNTRSNDMRFRKGETVVYGFSATQDETVTPGPENMYLLEISTHMKRIRLITSKAMFEPFAYTIELNTGEGFFTIKDDSGNRILLDSKARTVRLENADGSFFDLTKDVMEAFAASSITHKTKDYIVESETFTLKASSSVDIETKTMETEATTNKITAATTHVGNIALQGNIGSTSGPQGNGDATFSGNINTTENIRADGTIHGTKVISDQDIEAPNVN